MPPVEAQEPEAVRILDRALELMGGEGTLRAIRTARFDFMTQWQRTDFRGLPGTDRPSYEEHVDVRDYRIPAWRNTRHFGARTIVNVVRDSVASTDSGDGPTPLSIAYVDEREEIFTYTPDRLVLALADAPDLTLGADTTLSGEPHRRLRATLRDRFAAEVFFHDRSGAPTLLRFEAGHPNDYGLVPWGEMRVEVWYAGWRTWGEVSLPGQWDVYRVGRPYRRFTLRTARFNPDLAPDSFRIPSDLRAGWAAAAGMPMHEQRPVSVTGTPAEGLLELSGFGFPLGAVQAGSGWVAIGPGQTGWNFDRAVEAIEGEGGASVTAVIAATAAPSNGGVVAAARRGIPIWTTPSTVPFLSEILRAGGETADFRVVHEPVEVGEGEAALRLVPFSLPDAPQSLLAFHPSSGWLWVPDGSPAFGVDLALQEAVRRGWVVRRVGTARQFAERVGG